MSFFDEMILGLNREHVAAYIRFVDDFEIYADSKELLKGLRPRMERWLAENLHVKLHPSKVYLQRADRSVKFVGTVIKSGRVYTSKKMVGDAYNAILRLDEAALYCWHVQSPENAKRLGDAVSTMNSYLGSMKHTLSYGIRRKIFGRASWLWKCCYVSGRFTVVRIRKEFLETHILYKRQNRL